MTTDQLVARTLRVTMAVGCLFIASMGARIAKAAVTTNGDYVIAINLTTNEYGDLFDELYGGGPVGNYYVVWFNADVFEPSESIGGGPPTENPYVSVNVVFKKNPNGLVFGHEFGIDADAMQEVVDICHDADLEMIQIEAYDTSNGIRYAYVWYDQDGPPWEALVEYTVDGFAINMDDLQDLDFQPVNICRNETPGGYARRSSLVKMDFSITHVPNYPILFNDLVALRSNMAAQGKFMTSLEVINNQPYDTRFYPVFKKMTSLNSTYDAIVHGELPSNTADINDEEMQGMSPVLIANVFPEPNTGLGWGAQPLSYALWRGKATSRHQTADDFFFGKPKPPEPGADDFYPETRDPFD